jgi:mannose-1-phosphate guanylyltransferase
VPIIGSMQTTRVGAKRATAAIILVGGQGTRLRPLTLSIPKPMLPIAGVPVLAHLLARIRDAGVTRIVLGTSYRADAFRAYFQDGRSLGVDLTYAVDEEPLGTGGAIRHAAGSTDADDVLVFNGDVLSGLDLRGLLAAHRQRSADVTLHLTTVDDPRPFGSVVTDERGRVTGFHEKNPYPVTDQINAGTYVFRRSVIDRIPAGRVESVERDTFPRLLADGAHICGFLDESYWRDVGSPAQYVAASADLVRGLVRSSVLPGPCGAALVLAGVRVDPAAQVGGGSTIGAGSVIGAGASVDGSVVFGRAVIGEDAIVRRSVLGFDVVVERGAVIEDAVIGDRASVGRSVRLPAGAIVSPGEVVPSVRATVGR